LQNQLKAELGPILIAIAVGLGIGLASGYVFLGLLLSLAGFLTLRLLQLAKVVRWMTNPKRESAPETRGLLEILVADIQKTLRQQELESQMLRSSLDQQTRLISEVRDGVLITHAGGRLLWSNKQAQWLLQIKPDRDHGLPLTHVIRNPHLHDYLAGENFAEPLRLKIDQQRRRWCEVSITQYAEGERLFLIRDVTRLQQLEQMRRDFVANLSHELKTPLTVLRGYLETLPVHENTSPSVARIHSEMEKQCERMSNLLKDLLLLAQLEDVDSEMNFAPVDVGRMLVRIREDAGRLSQGTHNIELEVDPDLKLTAIENELFSAFSNLIVNAVRHTPEGSKILIKWFADDFGAHLLVEDDGPGIDDRHLRRLTERFYRVEASRNSSTGGTGLGLAIVKHVMLRQGAELNIESTLGSGSTFSCHFPSEQVAGQPAENLQPAGVSS
jgi:two-component system phosphate regulon sensor histidine kinase PhoR